MVSVLAWIAAVAAMFGPGAAITFVLWRRRRRRTTLPDRVNAYGYLPRA